MMNNSQGNIQSKINTIKTNNKTAEFQDKQRSTTCFHFKNTIAIFLLLFILQILFYNRITNMNKKSGKQTLAAINQINSHAFSQDLLQKLHNLTNFDALEIKLADINEKVRQFQQWAEYQTITTNTIKDLTERQKRLQQLGTKIQQIQKIRNTYEETTLQPLDQESSEYRFLFPKKIWVYDQLKTGYFEVLNELYLANIRRVGTANSFDIQTIDHYSYFNYIRRSRHTAAVKTLEMLAKRYKQYLNSPLPIKEQTYKEIQKTLIMLLVLEANGGISVSQPLALVQNFDWLRQITKNIFINRGASGILPKVFGFHNISRSSSRLQEKGRTKENRFKFLIKYPGMLSYFLVAVKGSQFVYDLINVIIQIIMNPEQFITHTDALRKDSKIQSLYFLSPHKVYQNYFEISIMITLLRKQRQMEMKNGVSQLIGLDHYGLITMNAYYGPEKTAFYFQGNQGGKIWRHLTKFELKQFQMQIGKVRYVNRLACHYEINDYINNMTAFKQYMIKNSYLHVHLYPDSKEPFIIENAEKGRIQQYALPWLQLTKIIWVYWHMGLENSNIIYQLCADNLRRYGAESGFQLKFVSDHNLQDYLDPETIEKIEYAVTHQGNVVKSKYIKFDLIRLALVAKHGGVYMDLSYVLFENLDWLINIARYPSNLIFNRYGEKPKVFMFFHPHYGSPFMWQVDPIVNSKIAWQLGYQNNFIAAEKGSELIHDWFEELIKAIQTPYEQLEKQFIRCQIYHEKWTSLNDIYLLSMDMIKYVVGRKRKELQVSKDKTYKDASDYYKIWSMNGYLGQQKFRSHTSYDTKNHDNLFLRLYSEQDAELMNGKARHLTKLYNYPVKYLMANFISNYDHLHIQFHEQSIFMKYIYNASRHTVILSGKNKEIQKLIINE